MKLIEFIFKTIPRKIINVVRFKVEHLYFRYCYSKPKLASDSIQKRYLVYGGKASESEPGIYRRNFSEKTKQIIDEADMICQNIFDLLGSGPTQLNLKINSKQKNDWQYDFKSGYYWDPKMFYRYISIGHMKGVDIKTPWELSRCQHLNIIGQAYVVTKNSKYADEFASQLNSWIDNNPLGFGVNWKCAMDAAIRASNWLVSMEYFLDDNLFVTEFLDKFYTSILEHGRFIRNHLEYSEKWTNNHYLADITGLFFIAVYCPFFIESEEWKKFAFNELHKEIDKQIHEDGCTFEASTSYHRLVLEMFFYSELLGQRAGIIFSKRYKSKVRKMFEASLFMIKPNGKIPQIGDNDSGRFLIFSTRDVLDHRYLTSLAAVHYKDSNFKLNTDELDLEALCVFGADALNTWDNLDVRETGLGSKPFPDTGWYILRNDSDYCFVSCGPNGGGGWHSHNDKLSFELSLNGYDLIVDPGTYLYTPDPEERNKFRSTKYHNTIAVNGCEQNQIPSKLIFNLPERVLIGRAGLDETDDRINFHGEIQYDGVTHARKISLYKSVGCCEIDDEFSCEGGARADVMIHFSLGLTFDGSQLLKSSNNEAVASFEFSGEEFSTGRYEFSPEYGVKLGAEEFAGHIPASNGKRKFNTIIKEIRPLT